MALVAGVAIIVIGPQDMPAVLYKAGKFMRKIRVFLRDMQSSLDNIVREAEVDELSRSINQDIGGPNVDFEAEKQLALEERRAREKDNVSQEINVSND